MAAPSGEIARLLDRAKRRQRRILVATALLGALAAAAGALLLGAAALALGARPAPARALALATAFLALLGAALWLVRALVTTARTQADAARALAAPGAPLRSALVSAVELLGARPALALSGAVSLDLLDAHVERTAAAARTLDLAVAIPDRPARRAGVALAAVAALHLGALAVGGAAFTAALARVVAGDPAPLLAPSLDPITGDVELTYAYPAYTRLPPRVLSGTGGEVRAPKGTEVTLRTRSDREVVAAEIEIEEMGGGLPARASPGPARTDAPRPPPAGLEGAPAGSQPGAAGPRRIALEVQNGRDLAGRLVVGDGGTYRFRFTGPRGRLLAEGPPIPIVVEPDAFPTVRITAPTEEVEVAPGAPVQVAWKAEDDYGLSDLALVTRTPGGAERRRPLRAMEGLRRDGGTFRLPLAEERLREGEKLLAWLEVLDNDAVSGPKKGTSATLSVKIYSEAEHRRLAMERARAAWEALLGHLGERLELFDGGPVTTVARLPLAAALDGRTREVATRLRAAAAEVRKEKAAPPEVARALANVAGRVQSAEQRVTATRQAVQRLLSLRAAVDRGTAAQLEAADRRLDEELEKGVLYLEALFDKARAEELVRMARDLARDRRGLQELLERYRDAPSDALKEQLLAEIRRLRSRMNELMARMAETARGFHDEHMNAEALADLAGQRDGLAGLDAAEAALRRGDVEAAMKALEEMAGRMDRMLAGLERTSRIPDERQRELMEQMLAFKEQLEQVKADQERTAQETERIRAEQRRRLAGELEKARQAADGLRQLAEEARRDLKAAQPAVPPRGEMELEAAVQALEDLQRALAMRDLDASLETVQRALPPAQRVAMTLEEDAMLAERLPGATRADPLTLREAGRRARQAVPKVARIQEELRRMQPQGARGLSQEDLKRLEQLAGRQQGLERQAGELQSKLSQLMQQAPVFPQSAPGLLGESRGHMGQAAGELAGRNPQRGHGEQQAALDALGRFQQGLREMAQRGGGQQGGGFPFPFGEQGSDGREGDGGDPAREKVEIPGAEAHQVPEQFRRDLLEAMKQGAPERYRGEVQRYYEEIVK